MPSPRRHGPAAAFALAALTLAAARPAAAATVYAQTPFSIGQGFVSSSWTSDHNTAASGPDRGDTFVTADNFTLSAPAAINALTWQGLTFDLNTKASVAEPASFTVQFRADAAGTPGAVLSSSTVGYQETVAGTEDLFGVGNRNTVYNYSAALPVAFAAAANTSYWVSIIGNTPLPGLWTWKGGTGGDGASYQQVYAADIAGGFLTGTRPQDRAFSLGAAVPEAPAGALLALSPALLGLIARRRVRASL